MADADVLFTATFREDTVTVALATVEELSLLAEPVTAAADDVLELWSLVAIHDRYAVEIHALGWRLLAACAWITSAVVAIDRGIGVVHTRSGRIYRLGTWDRRDLDPELRAHFRHALRQWNFEDVQP